MQVSVESICQRALRLCGQIGAPGRPIGTEAFPEVLNFLNQMLDSWNTLRSSIYQVEINQYELIIPPPSSDDVDTPYYTIGPTGDFVADRPEKIEQANLILVQSPQNVRLPLAILDYSQWSMVSVPAVTTTVPQYLYPDESYPDRRLYLWPVPTQANFLELFTWLPLPNALEDDDNLSLPDGYIKAVVYNLAVECSILYWQKNGSELGELKRQAQIAKANIAKANAEIPKLYNDAAAISPGPPQPYFNWKTGDIN